MLDDEWKRHKAEHAERIEELLKEERATKERIEALKVEQSRIKGDIAKMLA